MKKPITAILALIAVAAIVVCFVLGSGKNDLQKQLDGKAAELEAAKADAAATLAAAKEEAATVLAAAREEAAAALEAAQEEAGKTLADSQEEAGKALADAQSAAEAARAELQEKLNEAEAARQELQAKLDENRNAVETAVQAVSDELNAKIAELEAAKTGAEEAAQAAAAALDAANVRLRRTRSALQSNAYLLYANGDWSVLNLGTADSEDGRVTVTPATVTMGVGSYRVGLDFSEPVEGLSRAAVCINYGEVDFPDYAIRVDRILVNGAEIPFTSGFTAPGERQSTRLYLYNEGNGSLPDNARDYDGDLSGSSAVIVNREDFASVSSVAVEFTVFPLRAYLSFCNADWSVQNESYDSSDNVKVLPAELNGNGEYTVGLEFAEPSEGLAFLAVGIRGGEKALPGAVLEITGVRVNGGENILSGTGYTYSDDGMETRAAVYSEWGDELPAGARTADGSLEGVSAKLVDPEAFTGVNSVEVTFRLIQKTTPETDSGVVPDASGDVPVSTGETMS